MVELAKDKYEMLLEPVLKMPINTLVARSVICGHVDGHIYVDSHELPQTFYIVHPYGMSYLGGKSNNETFNKGLFQYFSFGSSKRKKDEWLQAYPRDWDVLLNELVDGQLAVLHQRVNLKFNADKFYNIYEQIDKTQYEVTSTPTDILFKMNGTVVAKDFWRNSEQFSTFGKAFTVWVDGKPASTAFAATRHGNQLEIGIETLEAYHGRGLAYLACAKLIKYCLDNQLEPVWSCRYGNTASLNLSKKLGFTEILRLPFYHLPKGHLEIKS